MDAFPTNAAGLFLEVVLKATAVIGLSFGVARLLRRRSAAARHWLWALSFAALAALPVLAPTLPRIPIVALPSATAPSANRVFSSVLPHVSVFPSAPPDRRGMRGTGNPSSPAAPAGDSWSIVDVAFWLWVAGFLLLFRRLVVARCRANQLVRRARAVDPALWPAAAGYRILASREVATPVTVGLIDPAIVVPEADRARTWEPDWRQAALSHEIAHVERRDPALELLVGLVCSVYWFHPLVWWAGRRLRVEREIAADDHVLALGTRASDYATFLVELAREPGTATVRGAVVPILTRAGLNTRLLSILDERTTRSRMVVRGRVASTVLALGALLPALAVAGLTTTRTEDAGARATTYLPWWSRSPRSVGRPSGFLSGRVFDAARGKPVAGAAVDLLSEDSAPLEQALSGPDGAFLFGPLPRLPGSDGYGLYVRSGTLAGRQRSIVRPAADVKVDIELRERGVSIAGRVLAEDGRPIAGAQVGFSRDFARWLHPGDSARQTSDAQGRYRIEGVLPSDLVLYVDAQEHTHSQRRVAVEDRDLSNVDFVLPAMRWLAGRVTTAEGRPVPEADVMLRLRSPTSGRYLGGATHVWTDSDGAFRYKGMVGDVELIAIHGAADLATPQPFVVPVARAGNIELVLAPGAFITGTVSWTDGAPAAGVPIYCSERNQNWMPGPKLRAPGGFHADSEGRFRVGPLPAGEYMVAPVPVGGALSVLQNGSSLRAGERRLRAADDRTRRTVRLAAGEQAGNLQFEIARP